MRYRQTHIISPETVECLQRAKNGLPLRVLAAQLGLPASDSAMLSNVLAGKPGALTRAGEHDLRSRLGLPPIGTLEVAPCPDCGGVHTGRCHGRLVTEVAVLTVGESVRRPASGRQRRTCVAIGGLRPETRAKLDATRRAAGLTWDAFLTQLA